MKVNHKKSQQKKVMLGAIFKASYNSESDHNIVGGICGTAFFIDNKNVLTANHLLNSCTFKPNQGFLYCKVWLLLEGGKSTIIEKEYLKSYPDIDTTKIIFPLSINEKSSNFKNTISKKTDKFILKGFLATLSGNPKLEVSLSWNEQGESIVDKFNLNSVISEHEGTIKEVKNISINKKDVVITNKKYLELSCGGNIGLSGAPLVKSNTGEIIGMMSIGLPVDVVHKKQIFAISIDEILKRIK